MLFRNKKYLTNGVINTIPSDVIFALFILIAMLKEGCRLFTIFEITTLEKDEHF